jgi:hypothetical protein
MKTIRWYLHELLEFIQTALGADQETDSTETNVHEVDQ